MTGSKYRQCGRKRIAIVSACAAAVASTIALLGCGVKAAEGDAPASSTIAPQQNKTAAPAAFVWWEAEDAKSTNYPAPEQNPFAPANTQEASVLSGGKWVGASGDRPGPLFLEYDVSVPKTANYLFYARKFWHHGPFRWRIDSGPWHDVRRTALLDDSYIRKFTGANWVAAGAVDLKAGAHTVRIETLENTGATAFDAFLLTTTPFMARGKMKPGEKYNRAPAGWFPFEPDADMFAQSPIDLRYLNEKYAGENGVIQVKNNQFVHAKTGKPIRFWAINTGHETLDMDKASADYMARSLAKYGVNMVRIHGSVWESGDFRVVDKEGLDRLQYFVTALKREGIYTCLSIYFPLWLNFDEKSPFAGYTGGKHPFALLYFNNEFQQIYRSWWKAVLTTPNPYASDKAPLGKDPAVAMLEMVNEDSYLFWTFTPYENIPGPQMEILEKQYGGWLTKKYGSLQKAFETWGGNSYRGDDAGAGRAGFMPLWEIFNKKDRRAQDTAAFLTESQTAFYTATQRYLKSDLGYSGMVYASNWITADARILGPLDKMSNSVADFMDRHGYFSGLHEGERSGYAISNGDKFADRSALLFTGSKPGENDYSLPLMDIQYNRKPSIITEVNWTPPNRFRADFPVVFAAYGLLQGTDGVFFFATGSPSWESSVGKFSLRTPVVFGQFPATALMYRQGMIQPGPIVVEANLKVSDVMALQGAPLSAPVNLDELRAKDIPAGKTAEVDNVSRIDPLAFLVGQVDIDFSRSGDTAGGKSRIADLSAYIDRDAKTVRSQTGQLTWNYGAGRVAVNAPEAQGITGFLSQAGAVKLKDVTISAGMEYGSVLLVALDNKPIAQSGRMLLQVMSEDANYGFDAPGSGTREIKDIGTAPLIVRQFSGTVSLARPDAANLKVTPLDFNGYPSGKKPLSGGAKSLTLHGDTLYYLIEK